MRRMLLLAAVLATGLVAAEVIPAGADPNCQHSQSWQCETRTSTSVTGTTATTPSAGATCGALAASAPPASYAHVVWIWMENKPYTDIIGSSAAPYENALADACGLASNYYAVTHPSLPNYIAATSGSTQGITDDAGPSAHPLAAASIFGQTDSASYEESMPVNCDLVDAYPYAVKHNPEAYYVPLQALCQSSDVPLTQFDPNNLPAFSFITPNLCNDTHDCSVATGDAWLQNFIPRIIASADYQEGRTVLLLTWDEDDGTLSNHVPLIVVSAYTQAGTLASEPFDHFSLLRTTEELLGLSSYLGQAADAASMRSAFHL